jgi:protein SCO1/2
MNRRDFFTCHVADKSRPAASLGPGYYSNGLFTTHENKKVRFYDDLIKGKISIINFMFTSCDKYCPRSIVCLTKLQDLLGDHLGRDMFMYSFSLKPDEDTPAQLAAYAKSNGARPGWLFLTGERVRPDQHSLQAVPAGRSAHGLLARRPCVDAAHHQR